MKRASSRTNETQQDSEMSKSLFMYACSMMVRREIMAAEGPVFMLPNPPVIACLI